MKIHEECGIFGGFAHKGSIAPFLRSGLFALQHRGQESAGICYGDKDLAVIKNRGLVMEVLTDNIIQNVKDKIGIGHVRYSTQGASDNLHAQPYMVNHLGERVAIAHNGNVQSAIKMRTDFEKRGEVFLTSSDTEMILKKVVRDIKKPSSKWTFAEVCNIL